MRKMEIKARAKINLTLDVLRKRPDGYHDVKMVMQTVDLYDVLTLQSNQNGRITVHTNLPYLPTGDKNIAYQAAQMFFEHTTITNKGLHIDISKNIPVAAGLAGGSTDAASVLIALNSMYEIGLSISELIKMGKQLGADVPYCIMGGTALAEGVGEVLTSLPPMPRAVVVLAKPPISVSTEQVYKQLDINKITNRPDTEGAINAIYNGDLMGLTKRMHNVLEAVTAKEHRIINRIKNIMLGSEALSAIMSGSGPTVLGIFEHEICAQKAVTKLRKIVKEVFVVNTYQSNYGER